MRRTWSSLFMVTLAASLSLAGCANVCDEVVNEAEANGCTTAPPSDDETIVEQECEGELEKRANCLLDLTENVCSLTEEEEKALVDCYAADGVD